MPKLLVLAMMAVTATAILLLGASFATWPIHRAIDVPGPFGYGLFFWIVLALIASSFPVQAPRGSVVSVSVAPILAAALLGGPLAAGMVGLIGTFDMRELRRQVPWYGTAYNHASLTIAAVIAGVVCEVSRTAGAPASTIGSLVAALAGGLAYLVISESLAALVVALRHGRSIRAVVSTDVRSYGLALVGLTPLSWLMALAYADIGPLVAVIFGLPLYMTRSSYASVVQIRRMFTQTVRALASAIDARDPSTRKHSEHVSEIAVEIGQVMSLSEAEIEQLEWGGLLHDIGKIGVRDAVLLKPDRLNRDEREIMNSHPQRGREILMPVDKLGPELPLILHHHQWFNGSGYPRVDAHGEPVDSKDKERYAAARPLVGEEIPFLARILHVADAFEAMTAARPYRLHPLTAAQALEELRKYSGVQFDPRIVEAFEKTKASRGESELPRDDESAAPSIPNLGEIARQRAKGAVNPLPQADVPS